MTQTVINPGDIKAIKKWSADLARDTNAQSYFSQRFVGKGKNSIIQQKTPSPAQRHPQPLVQGRRRAGQASHQPNLPPASPVP